MWEIRTKTICRTQSSESKMGKDGNRLLEMKIDRGYEDYFERRDGEEVVIVFVARTKKN